MQETAASETLPSMSAMRHLLETYKPTTIKARAFGLCGLHAYITVHQVHAHTHTRTHTLTLTHTHIDTHTHTPMPHLITQHTHTYREGAWV